MVQSTAKLLARLKELSDDAGVNYYERISIADSLMQDREWLKTSFKSDDYAAAEYLQDTFFHDLSGSMTIWMLLQIYRKFPNKTDWKNEGYNLRTLYAKCKPPIEKKTGGTRVAIKVADHEKLIQEVKEKQFEIRKVKQLCQDHETELEALQKTCNQLERENLKLKGRIEELERILSKKFSIAS